MKELLRTISGSHLYGTNLPESDTDYKVIYLPDFRDLLLAKRIRNKCENTSRVKNTAEDIDIEYIPVHQFVKDFASGQTYAIELAFCPSIDTDFDAFVKVLRENYLTKNISAMVGYCLGQSRKYSAKGDRLNAVRLVIKQFNADFDKVGDIAEQIVSIGNKYITTSEDATHTHLKVCDKLFPFSVTKSEALERLLAMEASFGKRANKAAEMNGADWKALMHACRVVMEAKQILTTHKLVLPFTGEDKRFLLDVRLGEIDFQTVVDFLEKSVDEVTELKEKSTLPDTTDVEPIFLEYLQEAYETGQSIIISKWDRISKDMAQRSDGYSYAINTRGIVQLCPDNTAIFINLHGEKPVEALDRLTGTTWLENKVPEQSD